MRLVRRFDRVGITTADLDQATAFFVSLGLEVEGTRSVESEFAETGCDIPGAHCEIATLRPPDGGSRLKLASYIITPDHVPATRTAMPNQLGQRNLYSRWTTSIPPATARAADGYGLVGGVGQ